MSRPVGLFARAALAAATIAVVAGPVALASTPPPSSASSTPSSPSSPATRPTSPTTKPSQKPIEDGLVVYAEGGTIAYVIIACNAGKPTDLTSKVLTFGPLRQNPQDKRIWGAVGNLKQDAPTGVHTVTAKCGGKLLTGYVRVTDGEPAPQPGATPSVDKKGAAKKVAVKPRGGVDTGAGGTAAS